MPTTAEHAVTSTPLPARPAMSSVTCGCGYTAEVPNEYVQLCADQHTAHSAAHRDPRLVVG